MHGATIKTVSAQQVKLNNKYKSLTLYATQRTSITKLILNTVRLTQYTRHAATAPTQRNDVNH